MSSLLSIEKQDSLARDKFARNGVAKVLHIVAKNIAFILHISSTVNLNTHPLVAKLFYDSDADEDQKEVDTLKATPMEYTAHVNDAANMKERSSVSNFLFQIPLLSNALLLPNPSKLFLNVTKFARC